MSDPKFKAHFLYEVTEDLEIAVKVPERMRSPKDFICIRKMIIPKGEILEFRYYSPAHFRDVFNNFFPIDEAQEHKLKEVAEIWENVAFANRASLYDIIRLALYTMTENKDMTTLQLRPNGLEEHFKGVHYKNL